MKLEVVVVGALCALGSTSFADAPGWSRGQQELSISWEECVKRAGAALQAESYRIDQPSPFAVGIKGQHTAVIMCNPSAGNKMWVNIVVASNGEGGGAERVKLQGLMDKPAAPRKPDDGPGWTAWLNRDAPDASADWEALADLKAQVPCERPVAIECRTIQDKIDWRQTGQKYSCSLEGPNPGGICINSENPGGCKDYEVRFRCPK